MKKDRTRAWRHWKITQRKIQKDILDYNAFVKEKRMNKI